MISNELWILVYLISIIILQAIDKHQTEMYYKVEMDKLHKRLREKDGE